MAASKNRIELDLHDAIQLVLDTVDLRKSGIAYNLLYITGDPGSGKTMMIEELTKKAGGGFVSYSPALERLEKFGGIPDLKWVEKEHGRELQTVWSIPQMITEINEAAEVNDFVVVLLDDWHLCIDELQQIGFELFTYYSLNGYSVHNNVVFVLAGNETSAAGARVQLSAIRNRSTLVHTHPNVEYWLDNYAIPTGIHPMGISFFNNKGNVSYFQEEESTSEQFGSPRSWTSAFRMLEKIEKNYVNKSKSEKVQLIHAVVQGSVSPKAAEKFMMHYEIFKNIDVDKIFEKRQTKCPEDNIERFCFSSAINYHFFDLYIRNEIKKDKKEQKKYCGIYGECVKNLGEYPEIQLMTIKDLGKMVYEQDGVTIHGSALLTELSQQEVIEGKVVNDLLDSIKVTQKG